MLIREEKKHHGKYRAASMEDVSHTLGSQVNSAANPVVASLKVAVRGRLTANANQCYIARKWAPVPQYRCSYHLISAAQITSHFASFPAMLAALQLGLEAIETILNSSSCFLSLNAAKTVHWLGKAML